MVDYAPFILKELISLGKRILSQSAKFTDDIYITFQNPKAFFSKEAKIISFLKKHDGKTIELNCHLDFSMIYDYQYELFDNDLPNVLYEKSLPIPNVSEEIQEHKIKHWIQFFFIKERKLHVSSGGTGIVRVRIKGKFDVETVYSGWNIYFYLNEV